MKMNELMNEGPAKKVEKTAKLAGATSDLLGASGEWLSNQVKKMDPRQIWNKDIKTTYSSADSKPGGVLDTYKTQVAAAEKQAEKNLAQVARQDKADARIDKLDKMRDKLTTRGRDTSRLDNIVGRQDAIKKDAASKIVTPAKVDKPDPTSQSIWQWSAPVGTAELGYRAATSSEADPTGDSLVDLGTDIVGAGARKIFGTPAGIAQGAFKDRDAGDTPVDGAGQEGERRDASDSRQVEPETTKESIADILKLSGQKSITERDNIAGIIKPKEIVALHESTQLEECGMMPSTPNQTASLSINATAGNGQEVANMLAAIMNLAGVKPVTGDMLGSSPMPPMPIVKAIDIISRGDSDSMNSHHHDHDHDDKETLTGSMEEEYGNTPKDPREVPELDTNAHAYQPNAVDVGDRMDGTMPKGFPVMTKESLLQAYTQFKNGQ